MSAFVDARSIPAGTLLSPDLAIVGGGPAGISLALALADSGLSIVLLESGGMHFDAKIQNMYAGQESGVAYVALDGGRLRFLGGSTNHWGGWCRPLDAVDFQRRSYIPHSGWPISQKDLAPYYPRAQALVEAGPWIYDRGSQAVAGKGAPLPLGPGGVHTSWFQFSKTRGGVLPTPFGLRYEADLKRAARVTPLLHANVMAIRLSDDARRVDRLDVASLAGNHFTVKPRHVVLACGGMETARLLLVSNDVMTAGIGNGHDLVGRYFADNPIPRNVATLVVFDGRLGPYYSNNLALKNGAILRATFAPTPEFAHAKGLAGSLTTVENHVALDALGSAAVTATAGALGVDASHAKAWSLGCGMELLPDPARRLTLTDKRDALGLPRLKLTMTVSDSDFSHFRRTLAEMGRQLLAAKVGMLRLNYDDRQEWVAALDWGNHHLGTTRMSDDPATGVVDADCKVHGVANLHVAGSSVFPTYGASNPTLNLLAVTLRLGEHLRKVMA